MREESTSKMKLGPSSKVYTNVHHIKRSLMWAKVLTISTIILAVLIIIFYQLPITFELDFLGHPENFPMVISSVLFFMGLFAAIDILRNYNKSTSALNAWESDFLEKYYKYILAFEPVHGKTDANRILNVIKAVFPYLKPSKWDSVKVVFNSSVKGIEDKIDVEIHPNAFMWGSIYILLVEKSLDAKELSRIKKIVKTKVKESFWRDNTMQRGIIVTKGAVKDSAIKYAENRNNWIDGSFFDLLEDKKHSYDLVWLAPI